MENKDFKKLISRLLEPYEFKRGKNIWYRRKDGIFAVLFIDKNPYCPAWNVGIGAEFAHTEYDMRTMTIYDISVDFAEHAIFPRETPTDDEWKKHQHIIPRKSIVNNCIRLDIFSDLEIEEYLNFNIQRTLVPMLTKESLLEIVHKDPYYLWSGREKNLHLYGFTEEEIRIGNAHVR